MINEHTDFTPRQAEVMRDRIAARYEGLQFAPLTRQPDTSRNRQRAHGRRSSRRFIL